MKRFLLLALTAGLLSPITAKAFWGKYESKAQAEIACKKWAKGGRQYKFWTWQGEGNYYKEPPSITAKGKWLLSKDSLRACKEEIETRQYLGQIRILKKEFRTPKKGVWGKDYIERLEVKKNFRF
tara:strand:+ start:263 stop:637 length:375 start_codon:yes stop_codon:yes gene_type:complete